MRVRNVYVADDDQAVLQSMAFLLDSFGYSYELFADPTEFLSRATELNPGCLITDFRMTEMTGFDLLAELRKRSIDWPAILMTSDNGPSLEGQARDCGFAGFLHKPIDVAALIDLLDVAFATLGDPGRSDG